MSTFNMTKKTNSTIKDVSLTLVLIGSLVGATLSTSANAATTSNVEDAVSQFVVDQGKKMIVELNTQLQQSIDEEIKTFTTNFSLNKIAVEPVTNKKMALATVKNKNAKTPAGKSE